eukprot:s1478_g9.t1
MIILDRYSEASQRADAFAAGKICAGKEKAAKKKQNCRGEYRLVASREGSLQTKQQQAEESLRDVQERFLQMEDELKRMEGSIQDHHNWESLAIQQFSHGSHGRHGP